MSKQFQKEDRYLVIKRSDINKYCASVPSHAGAMLRQVSNVIESHRQNSGKEPLECVVVEHDWPIYDDVWKMVEAIATNQPTELERLRKENEQLKSNNPIDQIIYELFSSRWVGDSVTSSLEAMKKQLHKNITSQVNGYWSGHTAYHILIDGGFIIDAPTGKKVATKLGQMFIDEMENSDDTLQTPHPHLSASALPTVVSLEPVVKKTVIDLATGIRIRSECNIEQPFDVKRSIKSIGFRIHRCIQVRDFERAARLHKVYEALEEVLNANR